MHRQMIALLNRITDTKQDLLVSRASDMLLSQNFEIPVRNEVEIQELLSSTSAMLCRLKIYHRRRMLGNTEYNMSDENKIEIEKSCFDFCTKLQKHCDYPSYPQNSFDCASKSKTECLAFNESAGSKVPDVFQILMDIKNRKVSRENGDALKIYRRDFVAMLFEKVSSIHSLEYKYRHGINE